VEEFGLILIADEFNFSQKVIKSLTLLIFVVSSDEKYDPNGP
jgi:hypothetical protein